jgi:predicted dehydrogenase
MSRRIAWGVLGSGGIAQRRTIPEGIVPASNAELRVVFDTDSAANRDVAQRYDAHPADSLESLLDSDIDAVYIATPACFHYGQALKCAEAGKHILCEKPLGMNVAEAERMVVAAREARVKFGTAFMMRLHSQHRAALALIREGRLGRPVYARAQLSCWYPPIEGAWRQEPEKGGGGSLMDMGGHLIDLLEMFLGPASQVSCAIQNAVHGYTPEDSAVALLRFACGALGSVDAFFCIPDESSRNVLEIYGSQGSILASGTIGQAGSGEMRAYLKSSADGYDALQQRDTSGGVAITPEPVNLYRAEIEEFSWAILEGRDPAIGGDVGIRSQKVLAACYESARTGRFVEIETA